MRKDLKEWKERKKSTDPHNPYDKGIALLRAVLFNTKDGAEDVSKRHKRMLMSLLEEVRLETAQEAYLECLREECGEGPCAEAIRTKFNLKL